METQIFNTNEEHSDNKQYIVQTVDKCDIQNISQVENGADAILAVFVMLIIFILGILAGYLFANR